MAVLSVYQWLCISTFNFCLFSASFRRSPKYFGQVSAVIFFATDAQMNTMKWLFVRVSVALYFNFHLLPFLCVSASLRLPCINTDFLGSGTFSYS